MHSSVTRSSLDAVGIEDWSRRNSSRVLSIGNVAVVMKVGDPRSDHCSLTEGARGWRASISTQRAAVDRGGSTMLSPVMGAPARHGRQPHVAGRGDVGAADAGVEL